MTTGPLMKGVHCKLVVLLCILKKIPFVEKDLEIMEMVHSTNIY